MMNDEYLWKSVKSVGGNYLSSLLCVQDLRQCVVGYHGQYGNE